MDVDGDLDGFAIPAVLREFYEIAKRWPIRRHRHYFGWNQNFFAYPGSLAGSKIWAEERLINFAYENQGVTWWGCPPDGDDPPVYDAAYEGNVGDARHNYPAGRCSLSLCDFLIGFSLFEIVVNHPTAADLSLLGPHINARSSEWQPLVAECFGEEMEMGLFAGEALAVQMPWPGKAENTWWYATRSEAIAKDLQARFAS